MRHFPAGRFEGFVAAMMSEQQVPGLAVTVVADGEIVYARGFGSRDLAKSLPVTPNTIFGVASVTKSFTALATMQIAEAGRLSVDDPVRKYLPGFGVPGGAGEDIAIHHFLSHTSGLPPLPALGYSIRGNTEPDPEPPREGPQEPAPPINTYDQLAGYLKDGDFTMLGKPAEYCSYSNDAYALMGAVIEKACGQPYDEYVAEHILRPLEMDRSAFSLEWALSQDDVTSLYYRGPEDQVKHSPNWQVAPPYMACGWLKSTAFDLANYVSMYASGGVFKGRRLVSPESLARMTGRHHSYTRDRWYGYGLSICPDYGGGTLVEHSGGLKGVSSNMGFVPEKGIGAAVLSNLSGAPAGKIWLAAVNLLLGLPIEHPRSVYAQGDWPAADLPRYAGRFKSAEGGEVVFSAEGGGLIAAVAKKRYEVRRDGEDLGVAVMSGQPSEVRFYFDEKGNARAIGYGGRVIRRSGD